MEDNAGVRSEIEIHGLSLIDVSSEDDSLLFSSFLDPSSNDFSEMDMDDKVLGFLRDAHDYDEEIPVSTLEENDQVLQPHESPEPEQSVKSGKYNLRKSLAWDNAFFTGAGFLEPEELSSMIESNHKGGKQNLSTIQEDLQRSTESISTFQSDCTVENSQEFIFFDDIRASIQRSVKASGAATPDKSKELVAIEAATSPMSSMVKDPVSQEKMKPKASPKKQSVRAQGLGKATNQPIASKGLSTSVSKPPKLSGKVRPMSSASTKRTSLDVNKTKQEKDSQLVGGKQLLGSRISISGSARSVLPRPVVSSKSSLRSSVASKNELTSSCSSLESCASASSSVSHKSSTNLIRKKNDPSSRLTSSLANRTISRAAPRNVTQPRIPTLTSKGTSKSKLSSNVSPASSVSDWSSESSRASTPNKMNKGNQKIVNGARGSASHDRPHTLKPLDKSNDESFVRRDSKVDELAYEGTKPVSAVDGGVVHPASMKPSGLRVPSPKIGFFDGVRSAARSSLPKHGGNSPSGSVAKTKYGGNSPSGSVAKTKYEKFQPARSPLQESSNSKTKASSISRSPRVVSVSSPSPKVQKKMYSKISAEEQLIGGSGNEEMGAGGNSSPSSATCEESRGKQSTARAKQTVKACPTNEIIKPSVHENMIVSIELPKEGEMLDKAAHEQSDKLNMTSVVTPPENIPAANF